MAQRRSLVSSSGRKRLSNIALCRVFLVPNLFCRLLLFLLHFILHRATMIVVAFTHFFIFLGANHSKHKHDESRLLGRTKKREEEKNTHTHTRNQTNTDSNTAKLMVVHCHTCHRRHPAIHFQKCKSCTSMVLTEIALAVALGLVVTLRGHAPVEKETDEHMPANTKHQK